MENFYREGLMDFFQSLYDKGGHVLWLYGHSGTGKTTAAKVFADKIGDSRYIDFKNGYGELYGNKKKNCSLSKSILKVAKEHSLVILDNFDIVFEASQSCLVEVKKAQETLKNAQEDRKVMLIVISRYRLVLHPIIAMTMFSGKDNTYYRFNNFDAARCRELLPNHSLKENIILYSIHGGMPWVLSFMSPEKSVKQNVISILENREEILKFIVRDIPEEDVEFCCDVMYAVARYQDTASKIALFLDVDKERVWRALSLLSMADLIGRKYVADLSRHNRTEIDAWDFCDCCLRFFAFFVMNGCGEKTDIEEYYKSKIEPNLDFFAEAVMPKFCFPPDIVCTVARSGKKNGNVEVNVILGTVNIDEKFRKSADNYIFSLKPLYYGVPFDDVVFSDYNLSSEPYSVDKLDYFLGRVQCFSYFDGKKYFALYSISGFSDEVKEYAKENGIMLKDLSEQKGSENV